MTSSVSEQKIELGCEVEWKSQAGGFTKKKQGEVVVRVPPGQFLNNEMWAGMNVSVEFDMPTITRAVESWLVLVPNVRKGRAGLYWPPPGKLKVVSAPSKPPLPLGHSIKIEPTHLAPTKPDLLPGITEPRGPLAIAAENYLSQAARVKEEKRKLGLMGDGILQAMQQEKRSKLTLEHDGESVRFEVVPSGFDLRVVRGKE